MNLLILWAVIAGIIVLGTLRLWALFTEDAGEYAPPEIPERVLETTVRIDVAVHYEYQPGSVDRWPPPGRPWEYEPAEEPLVEIHRVTTASGIDITEDTRWLGDRLKEEIIDALVDEGTAYG